MKSDLERVVQDVPERCKKCVVFMQIENPLSNYFLVDGEFNRLEIIVENNEQCLYTKSIFERRLIDKDLYKKLDKCKHFQDGNGRIGFTRKNINLIQNIIDFINLELNIRPSMEELVDVITSVGIIRDIHKWENDSLSSYCFGVPIVGELDNYSTLRVVCNEFKNRI